MSSPGAAITALSGRGTSAFVSTDDYRFVLPPLPSRSVALNSVLLHGDVSGRPYKIADFRAELERLGIMGDIDAFGGYQMNHLWMLTLKTAESKRRVVEAAELNVKGKRCVVIDPDTADIRMKLHWIPFHVSDDAVRKALEPFGKTKEITRDVWRAEGFAGIQSTTRLVRLSLKEGVTLDRLPHELRIADGKVLVVVPGRPQLCLRCKGFGHIRRECRRPRCERCGRYGHERANCVITYATVTEAAATADVPNLDMDEEEAEAMAEGDVVQVAAALTTTPNQPEPFFSLPEKYPVQPAAMGTPVPVSTAPTVAKPSDANLRRPEHSVQVSTEDQDVTSEVATDDEDDELSDSGESLKRLQDQRSEDDGQARRQGRKWKKVTDPRRSRFNPKTRLPTEEHRRKPPE